MSSTFPFRTAAARLMQALLLLALAAMLTTSSATAQQAFAKFEAESMKVSLDDMYRGDRTSTSLTFKNAGLVDLEILNHRTNCSCATLTVPKVVAPGATAKIDVAIDSFKVTGPTKIKVFLATNDPDNPNTVLEIDVKVIEILGAHPGVYRYIVYQNFEGDAVIAQTVAATDNTDIKILKVESPYEFLRLGEPRVATAEERLDLFTGEQWYFEARLDQAPPVGALVGNIIVHTDHPQQPRMPIPISGFVRPLVALTPQKVDFGTFELPENGTYLDIHVKQFSEEPMALTKIECDIDGIEIETRDLTAGHAWKLRAVATPKLQPGPFKGTITLHTDHPRQKTIEVPISGTMSAKATEPSQGSDGAEGAEG